MTVTVGEVVTGLGLRELGLDTTSLGARTQGWAVPTRRVPACVRRGGTGLEATGHQRVRRSSLHEQTRH